MGIPPRGLRAARRALRGRAVPVLPGRRRAWRGPRRACREGRGARDGCARRGRARRSRRARRPPRTGLRGRLVGPSRGSERAPARRDARRRVGAAARALQPRPHRALDGGASPVRSRLGHDGHPGRGGPGRARPRVCRDGVRDLCGVVPPRPRTGPPGSLRGGERRRNPRDSRRRRPRERRRAPAGRTGRPSRAGAERSPRRSRYRPRGSPLSLRLRPRHDAAPPAVRRFGDGLRACRRAGEHDARHARLALHGTLRERAPGPLRRRPPGGPAARDVDADARRSPRGAGLRYEQRRRELRVPRPRVRAGPRLRVGRRAAAPVDARRDPEGLGARRVPTLPLPDASPLARDGHARPGRGRDHGRRRREDRPREGARPAILSLRELLRRARARPRPVPLGRFVRAGGRWRDGLSVRGAAPRDERDRPRRAPAARARGARRRGTTTRSRISTGRSAASSRTPSGEAQTPTRASSSRRTTARRSASTTRSGTARRSTTSRCTCRSS